MTNALVPRAPAMAMGTLADPRELGTVLAASGYFNDARDAAQAVVKVLAGAELGFGPIASMTGVYIVKGRVTLSANLMAASIKRHPKYDYRVRDISDDKAVVAFFEIAAGEREEVGESEFTMDMARKAGLAGGENWKKYPRNMLLWRAMSNGAKFFCPDAFSGAPVYTPDELGADIDPETGEILEATVRTSAPVKAVPIRAAADTGSSGEVTGSANHDDDAGPAKAGAAFQESPAPAEAEPKPMPEPTSEPEPEPDRKVTPEEVAKLHEYLATVGAPETFAAMALMSYDVADLDALTVRQAHEVMERAKSRYGATA